MVKHRGGSLPRHVPLRRLEPGPDLLAAPCHLVGLVPWHILGELAE